MNPCLPLTDSPPRQLSVFVFWDILVLQDPNYPVKKKKPGYGLAGAHRSLKKSGMYLQKTAWAFV